MDLTRRLSSPCCTRNATVFGSRDVPTGPRGGCHRRGEGDEPAPGDPVPLRRQAHSLGEPQGVWGGPGFRARSLCRVARPSVARVDAPGEPAGPCRLLRGGVVQRLRPGDHAIRGGDAAGADAGRRSAAPERRFAVQARFRLRARGHALSHPKLVLDENWFDGITLNSTEPGPTSENGRGGRFAMPVPALGRGQTLRCSSIGSSTRQRSGAGRCSPRSMTVGVLEVVWVDHVDHEQRGGGHRPGRVQSARQALGQQCLGHEAGGGLGCRVVGLG
jgi:hypothetical protein